MSKKYNLKILPVKPYLHKTTFDFDERLPNINEGAMVVMVAPPQSGKSTTIVNLLQNENLLADRLDEIFIFSPTIFNDKTSRFLKEKYKNTCYDHYDDSIIENIIKTQELYPEDERPSIGIILDDIVGMIPKNSSINYLCSRYRHFGVKLLLFSTQLIKGIPPVVRANASNVILFPNSNQSELNKIIDEWGFALGGKKKFMETYCNACNEKYQFLHIDLSSTPSKGYKNFDTILYENTFSDISKNMKENI